MVRLRKLDSAVMGVNSISTVAVPQVPVHHLAAAPRPNLSLLKLQVKALAVLLRVQNLLLVLLRGLAVIQTG